MMRLLERQSDGGFSLTGRIEDKDIARYPYAILSHRWGTESEEVIFEDLFDGSAKDKAGYRKIQFCAEQAQKDDLQYFWVDSCCIKKSNESELSESINSMFRYYRRADKCYVYLSDVSTRKREGRDTDTQNAWKQALRESKWFTRGWTLQELLAPVSVEFFSSEGDRLGDRESLKVHIHEITGISIRALEGSPLQSFSVAERKKWAATRVTTKKEDEAYCLIGIFDLSMAIRYGEGREKAFQRLDRKIQKAVEQTVENKRMAKIIEWLSPPDPFLNYEKALKQRQTGTGVWFLQHKSYIDWKSGHGQFLWLHGIPGCGKSVLSSTIIEDLEGMVDQLDGGTVAYFYFDFNDPQKRRPDLMVRSILAQLLRKCVEIPTVLTTLFSSCDKGQRQPPVRAYIDTLREIIIEAPRMFIVLDALDECGNREELLEIITFISEWKANNLQILLTSRKERDIEDTLVRIVDNENIISFQSDLVDQDIQAYIIERLSTDQKLKKWQKDNCIEEIKSVLMKKAHGMFRWAACQLDALAKCRNQAQLQKSLSTLPATLDGTYERILHDIKEDDIEIAVRILRWLSFSARPLLLEEIAEIAAFDPERQVPFDTTEILVDPLDVLDICSSLVTITTISENIHPSKPLNVTSQAVVLAHYSVQEYLTSQRCSKGQASQFAMDESASHALISESCLSILLSHHSSQQNNAFPKLNLYSYSAEFWMDHGGKGRKDDRWTQRAITFLSDSNARLQWIRTYNPDIASWMTNSSLSLAELPQCLYFASLAGFAEVTRELIEKWSANVNAPGGFYGNALNAASTGGHEKVTKLLLANGADVNAEGGYYSTALQTASAAGHENIVELLLANGAEVNAQRRRYYSNALQAASGRGYEKVVELLLAKGADINAQGGHYGNALQAASAGGHEKVVELLLANGADVNAPAVGYFGNALQAASAGGYEKVVEMLHANGADVNAQGGYYDDALQAALSRGHEKVVELLRANGAKDDTL